MNDRLDWLQSLRGVAALMVLFFHLAPHWALVPGLQPFTQWMKWGFSGVDVFFVISGFVVYKSGSRSIPERGLLAFFRKRAARIYLTYWPTFLMVTAVSVFWLDVRLRSPEQMLFSFFLLYPKVWDNWIGVAWSLTYELYFYGVLGLLLLLPKKWHAAAVSAVAVGLILWNLGLLHFIPNQVRTNHQPLPFVLGGFIVEFLAGALIAMLFEARRSLFQAPWFNLPLGAGLVLVGFFIGSRSEYFNQIEIMRAGSYGLVALGGLLVALALEQTAYRPNRLFVMIGNFSFSLYLVHDAALGFLGYVRHHHLPKEPSILLGYSLVMPVIIISASYVWYLAVEARTIRLIK